MTKIWDALHPDYYGKLSNYFRKIGKCIIFNKMESRKDSNGFGKSSGKLSILFWKEKVSRNTEFCFKLKKKYLVPLNTHF